ncbi:MAG: type IV toxin-antitoxin system AbiEi family antitoxin domain-containing protein [Actinomycetia bacterium]|nr:type IV toxin-antitoxin system AbiEi family antitoxin domain-containing protein [Actinomycetes bacterium]
MPEHIHAIMRRQWGLTTLEQAVGAGLSRDQVQRLVASGAWVRVRRGVYRSAAVVPTWQSDLLALVLDTGGVASHRSAARAWELDGSYPCRPEITLPHPAHNKRVGSEIHASTQFDLVRLTRRQGIPVTSVDRTLLDVAAVVAPHKLTQMIDDALRRNLITFDALTACLVSHSIQGRNGAGPMREELDRRLSEEDVPLSAWSRAVAGLLTGHGLPDPRFEHRIETDSGFVAQVDLAYPDLRIAVELDSVTFHLRRERFTPDAGRRNRITNAGWHLLTVTWDMYAHQPGRLVADVVAARHLRL